MKLNYQDGNIYSKQRRHIPMQALGYYDKKIKKSKK